MSVNSLSHALLLFCGFGAACFVSFELLLYPPIHPVIFLPSLLVLWVSLPAFNRLTPPVAGKRGKQVSEKGR